MLNGIGNDQKLRDEIRARQNQFSGGWVTFPLNCICSCGYDFTEDETALTQLKSGCPKCHKSFCE